MFDGVCNLCNDAVQFVIKQDKKGIIKFASLQSNFGQTMLLQNKLPIDNLGSFVYLKNNKCYTKSTAALLLLKDLGGFYYLFYAFIIVPTFLRDAVYNVVAKNRYKWFGKQDFCMLPSKDLASRFIE